MPSLKMTAFLVLLLLAAIILYSCNDDNTQRLTGLQAILSRWRAMTYQACKTCRLTWFPVRKCVR
jgi:hypothetical protein